MLPCYNINSITKKILEVNNNIKSIIIVESPNDAYFYQALMSNMRLNDAKIDIISQEEKAYFDDLQFEDETGKVYKGLSEKALSAKLQIIRQKLSRLYPNVEKVGFLLDMDTLQSNGGLQKRLQNVNNALQDAWNVAANILAMNTLYSINCKTQEGENIPMQVACYFANIKGEGELETLLFHIANKENAHYANCLQAWKECYTQKEIDKSYEIKNKEFQKFWIEIYKRFDTLPRNQRNETNTNFRNIMLGSEDGKTANRNHIFDLNAEYLTEVKTFLHLFL